ncbi:MAG: NHL repeat-containing protein [Ignavibacteria bacterium]|nr:NHL repeat-containing protein [Ignavibacteria bacterium]
MLFILLFNILLFNSDSILVRTGEAGDFQKAVSITSDGKGKIYVLDAEANEVIKFDESLKIEKRVGRKGWNNGEFDSPTSIDGSSGLEIYVSDGKNFRIQRFDLNLSYITSIITNYDTYQENLKFQTPVSTVYISPYIYVIDGENNRIVTYQYLTQNSGTPAFSFGGFQSAQVPLIKPSKILKDGYNNVYVLDKKQSSVFKYDNFGNYISVFSDSSIYSASAYNNKLYILNEGGILVYDAVRNAFTGKILFAEKINTGKIKDFIVLNSGKFYLLESNKINEYSLK